MSLMTSLSQTSGYLILFPPLVPLGTVFNTPDCKASLHRRPFKKFYYPQISPFSIYYVLLFYKPEGLETRGDIPAF